MKVQSLDLKYFKKFRDKSLDFTNEETGLAQDLIVLVGMNGSGKTSILQALAATLGTATRRLQKIADLDWPGFNYELLGRNWGRFNPQVTVQVEFSSSELKAVSELYQKIFPERSFEGPEPRENIDDILSEPWFYLYDGKNQYEISEMSGGERAIFPLLMDFANWNIHNSVILIDEIELHLHPPLQQKLLRVLPDLGNNNQFIITTHSDYVANLVPETKIVRL